ncbi:phosphatase PAP2 family protein [Citricoccus zhacaiensis]
MRAPVLAVLGWAGVTWSRVYLDRHQVSDVVLGSILGGLVGVLFLVLA